MTELLRAVLDTNIYVAAFLSKSPTSPTNEILDRWEAGEFILLITAALLDEVIEKLNDRGIDRQITQNLIARLDQAAVNIFLDAVPAVVAADPDDDVILACAVNGGADYLVTYDSHLLDLGEEYQGIKIVKALSFLWKLRGDEPPSDIAEN